MRTLLCGAALLAVIAAPAMAETRYDRKLEQAVAGIVARKMGYQGRFFLQAGSAACRRAGRTSRCCRAPAQAGFR
ncbi:hypothetical protein [Mesorhizobium sp. M0030]|uniref:hypothetical protein n=1 Tax=Mesorhizobium sp. M0030 TaxID=2956851 RepID=UPI003338C60F